MFIILPLTPGAPGAGEIWILSSDLEKITSPRLPSLALLIKHGILRFKEGIDTISLIRISMLMPHCYNQETKEKEGCEAGGGREGMLRVHLAPGTCCAFPTCASLSPCGQTKRKGPVASMP